MNTSGKILSRAELRQQVDQWRSSGERITLVNGNFDLLHVGHVRYLRGAKQLGGKLVVAINSDSSVRALKGEGRPVMPENERAEIVAALADVDAVVIFPEMDVRAIIREIRGGHYDLLVMGVSPRPGEQLFFGEVPAELLERAPCSLVFVASEPPSLAHTTA